MIPPASLRRLLRFTWPQIDTQGSPPSGFSKLYFKSDGYLYTLSSTGLESRVGGLIEDSIITASGNLAALQVSGTIINNNGQVNDVALVLPPAAEGYDVLFLLTTTVAKYFRVDVTSTELVNLDGVDTTAGQYIGVASAVKGNKLHCYTASVDAGFQWFADSLGPWVAG